MIYDIRITTPQNPSSVPCAYTRDIPLALIYDFVFKSVRTAIGRELYIVYILLYTRTLGLAEVCVYSSSIVICYYCFLYLTRVKRILTRDTNAPQ